MKVFGLILFWLIAPSFNVVVEEQCTDEMTVVKKRGNNCQKIADDKRVTVEDIEQFNNISCSDGTALPSKLCLKRENVTKGCVELKKAVISTSCAEFFKSLNTSETEFIANNPGANCTDDKLTFEFCQKMDIVEDECKELETIDNFNTCSSIAKKYALSLKMLEENYNCGVKLSTKSKDICISDMCQYRYKIENNITTCKHISRYFKIQINEIEKYNDGIKCNNIKYLPQNISLCVWPLKTRTIRQLPDMTCTKKVEKNSKKMGIDRRAHGFSMSRDTYVFLNKIGANSSHYCTETPSLLKCVKFHKVNKGDTCSSIAKSERLDVPWLERLNPTLRCENIDLAEEICVMHGYFKPTHCVVQTTRWKTDTNCSSIYNRTTTNETIIEKLNPGFNCTAPHNQNIGVCVQSFGMETQEAHEKMAEIMKNVSLPLHYAYIDYINNTSNAKVQEKLSRKFLDVITNSTVYEKLKYLKKNDQVFADLINNYERSDFRYCEWAQGAKYSIEVQQCFCSSEELMMYCKTLITSDLEQAIKNDRLNGTSKKRTKRSLCTLSINTDGDKDGMKCSAANCPFPLFPLPLELVVTGKMCYPDLGKLKDYVDLKNPLQTLERVKNFDAELDKLFDTLIETSISLALKLCLAGTNLLEKIGIKFPCWEALKIEYAPLAHRLTFSTELNLGLIEAKASLTTNVPTIFDIDDACVKDVLFCHDYCQRYTNYGGANIYAKVFWLPGITILDEKWQNPMERCSLQDRRIFFYYDQAATNFHVGFTGNTTYSRHDEFKEKFDAYSVNATSTENINMTFQNRTGKTMRSIAVSGPKFETLMGPNHAIEYRVLYVTVVDRIVYFSKSVLKNVNMGKRVLELPWNS